MKGKAQKNTKMVTFSDYMIDSYKKISFSKDKKRLYRQKMDYY